ncbi:40S ribosomal protein S24, partial [Golovinomyces cichoracearum]
MADREAPVTLRTRKFIRNVSYRSIPEERDCFGTYESNECGVSDILHPNRANISKDELRGKLAEMYKASKEQVNVFGLRTQFGGGKTTGFGLIYDSPEALKKFEPHYRLVRVGVSSKIEKPSRQQRMQTTQKQAEDSERNGQGQGCKKEE